MRAWAIVGILAGLFAAIGASLDRLLLRRQKSRVQLFMLSCWARIDDLQLPNLAARLAERATRRIDTWPRWAKLSGAIGASLLLSWAATLLGEILDRSTRIGLVGWPYYALSASFDFVTLTVTFGALRVVARSRASKGFLVLLGGSVAAALLASLNFYSFFWSGTFLKDRYWAFSRGYSETRNVFYPYYLRLVRDSLPPDYRDQATVLSATTVPRIPASLALAPTVLRGVLTLDKGRFVALPEHTSVVVEYGTQQATFSLQTVSIVNWKGVLISVTTFLPIAAFLTLLAALVVAKGVLGVGRVTVLHFLELATEADADRKPHEFIPGTLFGLLCGALLAIAKAAHDLLIALR